MGIIYKMYSIYAIVASPSDDSDISEVNCQRTVTYNEDGSKTVTVTKTIIKSVDGDKHHHDKSPRHHHDNKSPRHHRDKSPRHQHDDKSHRYHHSKSPCHHIDDNSPRHRHGNKSPRPDKDQRLTVENDRGEGYFRRFGKRNKKGRKHQEGFGVNRLVQASFNEEYFVSDDHGDGIDLDERLRKDRLKQDKREGSIPEENGSEEDIDEDMEFDNGKFLGSSTYQNLVTACSSRERAPAQTKKQPRKMKSDESRKFSERSIIKRLRPSKGIQLH